VTHGAKVKVDHVARMAVLGPPMLTQEQAVEAKVLKRKGEASGDYARGRAIARDERRYLQDPAAGERYGSRAPRPGKLDGYTDYPRGRIEAAISQNS